MASATAFAGSVPANYDKYLGPALFEPYAVDLVKRLGTNPWPLLEIACGTGRVTRHLASLLPEGETMVATDLNPDMIAIAKKVISKENIKWQIADAHEMQFDDESFNTVVCQFGIMFFSDKPKALKQVYRILKNEGKFLFNTWDSLDNNDAVALLVSVLHEIMGDNSPDFLEKGPHSFFNKEEIRSLLENAGFKSVSIETVQKPCNFERAENIVTGFVEGSPLASYLDHVDASLKNRLKENFYKKYIEKYGTENVSIPMQALIVEASK
jgi:ubiquinone/menaquinone biosynthesis C-methylase UbiE